MILAVVIDASKLGRSAGGALPTVVNDAFNSQEIPIIQGPSLEFSENTMCIPWH